MISKHDENIIMKHYIEMLQSENEKFDISVGMAELRITDLEKENARLKEKLRIAVKALDNIHKSYGLIDYRTKTAGEALKQIT